jgi:hypothetical protein
MTVIIEKPAVNLREELADLRNQGTYQEQQFYFDGLVTNGTFDSDTAWSKTGATTISGGTGNLNGTTGVGLLFQNILTLGKAYYVVFDVVSITGTLTVINNDGTTLGTYTTTGQKTLTWTHATANGNFSFRVASGSNVASVDNVSVYETDGTDVIHTMPKGWKPKDVFEDGLLQREGAAHDYTVVYDGFDYVVKPAVAPTATTQTCVIGVRA